MPRRIPRNGGTPALIRSVAANDVDHLTLARQGRRMAFVEWGTDVNVWRLPGPTAPDSTAPTRFLASTTIEQDAQVSPDGTRLVYVAHCSGDPELWISRADGTQPMQLTTLKNPTLSRPRWAPDGRRLAFEARTGGQADVYLIGVDGGPPQRLTTTPHNETAPSWSADGRFVYFSADRDGAQRIWKQPAAGGVAVPVTQGQGLMGLEAPDGRSLFFTAVDPATGRLRLKEHVFADGREVLHADTLYNQSPYSLAASRTSLYYLKWDLTRSVFDLYRMPFDTRQPARIATLPRSLANYYFERGLAAAPDDQWLLFGWIDRTESDIMMMDPFVAE